MTRPPGPARGRECPKRRPLCVRAPIRWLSAQWSRATATADRLRRAGDLAALAGIRVERRGRQSICWPPVASSRPPCDQIAPTPLTRPSRAVGEWTSVRRNSSSGASAWKRTWMSTLGAYMSWLSGWPRLATGQNTVSSTSSERAASSTGSANVAVGRNRYQERSWNTPGGRLSQSSIHSQGRSSRLSQNGNIGASGGSSSLMGRSVSGSGTTGIVHASWVDPVATVGDDPRHRLEDRPTRPGSWTPRATRRASSVATSGPRRRPARTRRRRGSAR